VSGEAPKADALLRRLYDAPEALSRNANFFAFDEPNSRRTRRVAAHMRSLRDQIVGGHARLDRLDVTGDACTLSLVHPRNGCLQRATVSIAELALLRGVDPRIDAAIAACQPGTAQP